MSRYNSTINTDGRSVTIMRFMIEQLIELMLVDGFHITHHTPDGCRTYEQFRNGYDFCVPYLIEKGYHTVNYHEL